MRAAHPVCRFRWLATQDNPSRVAYMLTYRLGSIWDDRGSFSSLRPGPARGRRVVSTWIVSICGEGVQDMRMERVRAV